MKVLQLYLDGRFGNRRHGESFVLVIRLFKYLRLGLAHCQVRSKLGISISMEHNI